MSDSNKKRLFADPVKRIRYFFSLLMILVMVSVGGWIGEREIIFPEMAALAIGMWIIDKRVWQVSRRKAVLLMTCGAVAGVCIARYSPFPMLVNLGLAFAFVAVCLTLFRTTLVPLISACVLPVLLGTQAWIYPAAVFVMTLLLVLGQKLMERAGMRRQVVYTPAERNWKRDVGRWSLLLGVLLLIAALPVRTSSLFYILPPLIVTYVEFANSKAGFRSRPVQVFLLLVSAAALGTGFCLAGTYFHLPETVTVLLTFICLFTIFEQVGHFFAPAGAMALIPLIVPQGDLFLLPFQAAAGAAVFIAAAMLVFQRCYRWPRPHLIVCIVPGFLRRRLLHR